MSVSSANHHNYTSKKKNPIKNEQLKQKEWKKKHGGQAKIISLMGGQQLRRDWGVTIGKESEKEGKEWPTAHEWLG